MTGENSIITAVAILAVVVGIAYKVAQKGKNEVTLPVVGDPSAPDPPGFVK